MKMASKPTARPGETGFGNGFNGLEQKPILEWGSMPRPERLPSVEQVAAVEAPDAEYIHDCGHTEKDTDDG